MGEKVEMSELVFIKCAHLEEKDIGSFKAYKTIFDLGSLEGKTHMLVLCSACGDRIQLAMLKSFLEETLTPVVKAVMR